MKLDLSSCIVFIFQNNFGSQVVQYRHILFMFTLSHTHILVFSLLRIRRQANAGCTSDSDCIADPGTTAPNALVRCLIGKYCNYTSCSVRKFVYVCGYQLIHNFLAALKSVSFCFIEVVNALIIILEI